MPGIATQFEILRLTIARLEAVGDPKGIAALLKARPAYAHLGAVGPLIGDFLPSDPFPAGTPPPDDYPTIWRRVFNLIGKRDTGMHHLLKELNRLLGLLQPIVDEEDVGALCELRETTFLDDMNQAAQKFGELVASLETEALQIAGIIGEGLRPKVCTENPTDPVPGADQWSMRDLLHWRNTGRFVQALIERAKATGDDDLLAYAYGYLVSHAGNACGNGFIDSIVGGPSRTQWWRQRFVRNYVDAWSYGYCRQDPRPTMAGDEPTPPYEAWPKLCNAQLQAQIEIGTPNPDELMDLVARNQPLPVLLPASFAQHWFEAFEASFPPPRPNGQVNADALNSAYLFTWLVLWFQSSGAVLGCDASPPVAPPEACADDPGALDPFQPAPGGGPTLPPEPQIDVDTDTAAKVCGIILAILAGLAFLGGGLIAGSVFLAGAIALLDCDSLAEPNWKKLRCTLFWYRMYLHNGIKGLHGLLKFAGFEYPYPRELASSSEVLSLLGIEIEFESGRNLTKARGLEAQFPSKCWDGSLLTFNQPPTNFETPRAPAYLSTAYPDFFLENDATNPLGAGDVKTGTPIGIAADGAHFRRGPVVLGATFLPLQFGNAVANAVDLLDHADANFPDWNLDGDRGLAYLGWNFQASYDPDAAKVDPAP